MGIGRSLLLYVMLTFAVLLSNPAYAQVAGATLAGTVTDTSGAAVPNAKVSIKNGSTGVERDITTDSAGFYSAPNLLPGVYDITASAPGFSTYRQTGITLTVGSSQTLSISLRVGGVTEQVVLQAQPQPYNSPARISARWWTPAQCASCH
jgi:hypothetical protein